MTLTKSFWARVSADPSTGCWNWTGRKTNGGYAQFHVYDESLGRTANRQAYRMSYEALVGPIPAGLHIDHLCRNRLCVNPAHLEPVTPLVNPRRAFAGRPLATHCKHGHEYTPENTWLRFKPNGSRVRICRRCKIDSNVAWNKRNRNVSRERAA